MARHAPSPPRRRDIPRTDHHTPDAPPPGAAVAVIVRTVNRPQFLRRALASVARQTLHDYLCVVVCDGGELAAVQEECARAPIDQRRMRLIDNRPSRGMEAASNLGIRSVGSELVAIHDDDDSWEPEFLSRTVAYLRSAAGARYGGVVTWSTYVSEVTEPKGPVIRERRPFRSVNVVQFMELARRNLFPPIAFLYRREIYERLGGYDEALPVLGDWEFNLRFLLEADIGVIREPLANYHHRDLEPDPRFGNSVIAQQQLHSEMEAVIRNALLRSTLGNGRPEGALVALATVAGGRALGSDEEGCGPKGVNAILRAIAQVGSEHLRRRLGDSWYLDTNRDVARAGVDPFAHWLRAGAQEGRLPAADLVDLARELVYEREAALRATIEEQDRELRRLKEREPGRRPARRPTRRAPR